VRARNPRVSRPLNSVCSVWMSTQESRYSISLRSSTGVQGLGAGRRWHDSQRYLVDCPVQEDMWASWQI
jgi:hypothetical protein